MVEQIGDSWSRLKTLQLKDVTQGNISDSIKESFLSEQKFIDKIISLHQAKVAQSTFGGSGVVPSSGAISTTTFTDSATTIKPSAGEVWTLNPAFITGSNSGIAPSQVTLSITDGSNSVDLPSATIPDANQIPLLENQYSSTLKLTSSMYLSVISDSNNTQTLRFPYIKEAI